MSNLPGVIVTAAGGRRIIAAEHPSRKAAVALSFAAAWRSC